MDARGAWTDPHGAPTRPHGAPTDPHGAPTDLSTDYMGLVLRNPLVASASPLAHTVEGVRRLARAGVGAVVLPSLFEEEVVAELDRQAALLEAGSERFAEARTYFPSVPGAGTEPRRHLDLVERSAGTVGIPVIASLNGATAGGWTAYARQLQDAGAAAIELNVPATPDPALGAGQELERRHLEILGLVRSVVRIPIAVKLSPHYSSIGDMARRCAEAGADGLVLFNRFLHPDVDPETLAVQPLVGLSTPAESRLPRTWIALLRRRLDVALAASTGVEEPSDVARYLLAGADVVMTTSALLRHGPDHAGVLLSGLSDWMARKGFTRVSDLRGLLAAPVDAAPVDAAPAGGVPGGAPRRAGLPEPAGRAGYVAALRAANATVRGPW